jgi:hypothetical protein
MMSKAGRSLLITTVVTLASFRLAAAAPLEHDFEMLVP